jgi:HTH-type transcriptional regulator / antitoxin HipB
MIVRNPAALGAVIRDRRRELGLEQRVLAEKVGVSRHWVIDVEKGKPGSEIGLVFRALRVLGIVLNSAPAATQSKAESTVDIDAVVEAARKPRR